MENWVIFKKVRTNLKRFWKTTLERFSPQNRNHVHNFAETCKTPKFFLHKLWTIARLQPRLKRRMKLSRATLQNLFKGDLSELYKRGHINMTSNFKKSKWIILSIGKWSSRNHHYNSRCNDFLFISNVLAGYRRQRRCDFCQCHQEKVYHIFKP